MKSKPGRFYYGWVIVGAMATLNFGLFIKPMGDDLGIGRAAIGWAQTAQRGIECTAPVRFSTPLRSFRPYSDRRACRFPVSGN
ncbi:MAG: hypothetical protein OXC95_09500 [Dehalococcoidia bacterium]|nr:hypothetical protein [Dehalococcoidia bacterium]